jgi:transcriptional regulator with XRE-family HTH domain
MASDVYALPPIDPTQLAVGRRLRLIREARGVSSDELARQMRVPREILALAERGRARLTSSELYGATLCLRIPMRLLFEGEVDPAMVRRI